MKQYGHLNLSEEPELDAPSLQSMEGHLQTSMEVWVDNNKNNIYNGGGGLNLQAVKEEKDLGVITHLNIGKQVAAAELTANRMLCMIRRSFVNCEEKMM